MWAKNENYIQAAFKILLLNLGQEMSMRFSRIAKTFKLIILFGFYRVVICVELIDLLGHWDHRVIYKSGAG